MLFDKAQVIRFTTHKEALSETELRAILMDLQSTFNSISVRKYAARGVFIEALAMYQRYILNPLVTLLRLEHTPRHIHYGPVHISRHLPARVVDQLETLHKNASLEDLLHNCLHAERLFTETFASLLPDLPV